MRLKSWMKRAVGAKKITTASKHCYVQLSPYPRGELQKYQAALALERASTSLTTRTRSLSGAFSIRAAVFAPPTLSGPGPDNPGSPPAHRRFSRPRVACPGPVAPSSPHHRNFHYKSELTCRKIMPGLCREKKLCRETCRNYAKLCRMDEIMLR